MGVRRAEYRCTVACERAALDIAASATHSGRTRPDRTRAELLASIDVYSSKTGAVTSAVRSSSKSKANREAMQMRAVLIVSVVTMLGRAEPRELRRRGRSAVTHGVRNFFFDDSRCRGASIRIVSLLTTLVP